MTTPLAITLATLPSGGLMRPNGLEREELERYLRTQYQASPEEKARRRRHLKRQELYNDSGVRYIDELIDSTYSKPEIRERLKAWARVARFDNPLKRITNELSTVYQKPAQRSVADPDSQARYLEVQRMSRQHERSRQINRLLNVHRSLFVGFRVRAADGRPWIDIVTPDQCYAITHPNDDTVIVALVIETKYRTAVKLPGRLAPRYVVWTEHESFLLSESFAIVEGSYEEHGIGRMPYVYVSLEPAVSGVWPGEAGEDLVGATMSAWFANTNLLKETKSASKFPVVQGDMSTAARDQAADSDEVIETPEGTAITTVDTSMDLSLFSGVSDHVIGHAANNYGMGGALVKHAGVQSAEAREVLRAPMKELRDEQLIPLYEFEREFVEVQVAVLRRVAPGLAFDAEGWSMKFGDVQTPLDPKRRLEVFEHARRLGVTNTIAFLQETQGLTEEQAWEVLLENVMVETTRNVMLRPLMAASGAQGGQGEQAAGAPPQASPPSSSEPPSAADVAA